MYNLSIKTTEFCNIAYPSPPFKKQFQVFYEIDVP